MKFTSIAALVGAVSAWEQLGHVSQTQIFHIDLKDQMEMLMDEKKKVHQENDQFGSPSYQAQSAAEKQDQLWKQVAADTKPYHYPSKVGLAGIFLEGMSPTFDTMSDAMPNNFLGHLRTKYIHSVGVVGKVKFVSNGKHPYTGIFEGADYGMARMSSAVQPGSGQALAPGMGLKFLRDGVMSADLVAMWSLDGQPGNWNFFANDFRNHVVPGKSTQVKLLEAKFSAETPFITEVGLSNFSSHDQAGKETSNVFPFELRFQPHESVKNLIPSELQNEDYMAYLDQLMTLIPADSTFYDVYALDKPKELGGTETLIGSLQLDGSFTTSDWGDQHLFFKHQLMTEDLKIKPEWTKYTAQYHLMGKGKCPYKAMLELMQ